MRRLPLLTAGLALALALAAPAAARPLEAGSLELQNGSGTVVLTVARGAFYGSLERGRLVVTDGPRTPAEVVVSGAEEVIERDERTTVYRGRGIRFRISGGDWRVGIQGLGINGSVVGRGFVTLRGEAGALSIDYGPFRRWPLEFRTITLGG